MLYIENQAIFLTEAGTCESNLFDPITFTDAKLIKGFNNFPHLSGSNLILGLKPKYDIWNKQLRMKLLVTPPMDSYIVP